MHSATNYTSLIHPTSLTIAVGNRKLVDFQECARMVLNWHRERKHKRTDLETNGSVTISERLSSSRLLVAGCMDQFIR